MKKYFIYASIVTLMISGVFFVIRNKQTPSIQNQTNQTSQTSQSREQKEQKKEDRTDLKAASFIKTKLYDVCQLFPKDKIEEFSGTTIINTEFKPHKELNFQQYLCLYYQEEPKYGEVSKVNISRNIAIAVIEGEEQIKRAQEGYKMLKYTTKQDKDIPFNHLLIFDEKGKFHHLDILLSQDYKLTIETWWSSLSHEEALQFVKKITLYFKDLAEKSQTLSKNHPSSTDTNAFSNQNVLLSQDESFIRNFVSQIEDGKADQAAKMMKINDHSLDQANSELQSWAVHFSNITSFKLLRLEKANENEWTDTKHIYKVVLDVWMDPRSANAPIPYYGWENGQNTRWITLEKEGDVWKIAEIVTGM